MNKKKNRLVIVVATFIAAMIGTTLNWALSYYIFHEDIMWIRLTVNFVVMAICMLLGLFLANKTEKRDNNK